jgi:hypothetical protein
MKDPTVRSDAKTLVELRTATDVIPVDHQDIGIALEVTLSRNSLLSTARIHPGHVSIGSKPSARQLGVASPDVTADAGTGNAREPPTIKRIVTSFLSRADVRPSAGCE